MGDQMGMGWRRDGLGCGIDKDRGIGVGISTRLGT
jgi:hypothetical protein